MGTRIMIGLLLWGLQAAAQTSGERDSLRERFQQARWQAFQEKVYLHTDRDAYTAGEYVWFRAYRTDATSHVPSVYSRFVYVELYNQRGVLVERLKVREEDGVFHGSLKLDPYLAAGTYCLRAYTYWMQNFDEDFYFKKEIEIKSAAMPDLRREVRWVDKEDGDREFWLRLRTAKGEIFTKAQLDCRMYKGQDQVREDVEVVDGEGWVQFPVRAEDSITSIRVQFRKKRPFEYQTTFQVPPAGKAEEVDVQFLPEGGHLLAGIRTQVNFKAVGVDGYGKDVGGEVVGDDGEAVAFFVSSHLGMGRFEFLPEAGRSYHALVQAGDTTVKRVELPAVLEEGIGLHAEVRDSALHYECRGTAGFDADRQLYLLVHCRGDLLSLQPIKAGWSGELPLEGLPAGIIHGVLVDGNGKVYSNRLSFVYPKEEVTVEAKTHWAHYGKRDKVQLALQLKGADSLSCSVAVVDSAQAGGTRWGSHIVDYFLLCSDLKGHVEEPGWYFDNAIPQRHRERMLDLLLSTQGWQRFDVGSICQGVRDTLPFFLEMAQGISGKVENLWGKQADKPKVFAVAPGIGLMQQIEVAPDGSFHLNVDFPDSTAFVFQALTKRNKKSIYLEVEKDSLRLPERQLFLAERQAKPEAKEDTLAAIPVSGDGISAKNYYYVGGQKVYLLDEAKAVDRRKIRTNLDRYENIADEVLEARDIEDEGYKTIGEWLLSIPRVYERAGGYFHINPIKKGIDKEDPVCIFINDLVISFFGSDVKMLMDEIPITQVDRMGYVKDPPMANGRIFAYIYLKPGYSLFANGKRLSFTRAMPLGYHEPTEFYQPKYEVEEERTNPEPDERATLYWNPNVSLTSQGKEMLQFYTSDCKEPFHIIIEGITPFGKVIRKVITLPIN